MSEFQQSYQLYEEKEKGRDLEGGRYLGGKTIGGF